ncbi:MAG: hypothetical protein JSS96_02275 [Bacteroidetes bacterium]|nr:hypothetical protein [Bacteroidota bacterium]
MHLIKVSPAIDKFYTYGDLTEDSVLETQYDYQLAHHHPKHKSFFIVYSSSTCKSGNKALIIFNAHVTIQFDTAPHIPTVNDLLELTDIAVKELNQLLQQQLPGLSIGPLNSINTIKLLSGCIATAYPR